MPVFRMDQKSHRSRLKSALAIAWLVLSPLFLLSQMDPKDSLLKEVTLPAAIEYAILHQPAIQQSLLDQQIVESSIKNKMSEAFPQIGFNFVYQRNFIVQSSVIGGNVVKLGVENVSAAQFTFRQNLFERDLFLANRTKKDVREQALLTTGSNKIDVAAEVSKAFYEILLAMQQIKIASENIVRIERSLSDAYNQYKSGIADKTDYKRATIALNNSNATKRSNEELLKARQEYLKSLMGYPVSGTLNIVHDTSRMEQEIVLDTMQIPDYTARIEYRLLETQKRLLQSNVKYYKWAYIPSLFLNGAYNLNYQNEGFKRTYTNNYPSSFAALTLGFPIFQGSKRKAEVRGAELELQRNELSLISFRNSVNAEYAQAMAAYKANLYNFLALKENLELATEVYNVIQLQYRSGIKAYLEVITAETDLRTSQINYFNAMYQVMTSKIDVMKALGQITTK